MMYRLTAKSGPLDSVFALDALHSSRRWQAEHFPHSRLGRFAMPRSRSRLRRNN